MDNITELIKQNPKIVTAVVIAVVIVILVVVLYFTGAIPGFKSESMSDEYELDTLIKSIMSRQPKKGGN